MRLSEEIGKNLIIIRGAGDLASGVAIRLHNCGFPVIMLDLEQPTVIRRTVSFAQAMYDGETTVENVKAFRTTPDAVRTYETNYIQVVADPDGLLIDKLKPQILIDAILAKKNTGTTINMAPLTIALGPGFTAGKDCHVVIETQRGHQLGSVIYDGSAELNTGIPGTVCGYGKERVLHSPCAGIFKSKVKIGYTVTAGDVLAYVDNIPVKTEISGKVRGMLQDDLFVPEGFKIADVDPRGSEIDHTKCSDKVRTISGGVLEAVLHYLIK